MVDYRTDRIMATVKKGLILLVILSAFSHPIDGAVIQDVFYSRNVTELWSDTMPANDNFMDKQVIKDVNGDWLDDVLVTVDGYDNNGLNTYEKCVMKRGKDGFNLWSLKVTGYDSRVDCQPSGDLTGDGLNDVLFDMYNFTTDRYTLGAKYGKNGTTIWQKAKGWDRSWWKLAPSEDLNGDRRRDVIFLNITYDWPVRTDITIKALSGNNGSAFWTKSFTGPNFEVFAYSAGDLDKDGNNDILLTVRRYYYPASVNSTDDIYALKGRNGVVIWSETKNGRYWEIPSPANSDLNGDGYKDLYAVYHNADENRILKIKSGKNGSTIWQRDFIVGSGETGYMYPYVINDVNGDGLNDILIKTRRFYSGGAETIIEVSKGNDGTVLWSTSIDSRNSDISVYDAGDLDGDKRSDLILNEGYFDGTTSYNTCAIIKGTNGSRLWQKSYTGPLTTCSFYPGKDLDANGVNDVVMQTTVNTGGSPSLIDHYELSGLKGVNGKELWKVYITDTFMPPYMGEMDTIYNPEKQDKDLNADGDSEAVFLSGKSLYSLTTTNIRDTLAPDSISGLRNVTYKPNYIKWVWTDPTNSDFSKVKIYINGIWKKDQLRGVQYYNATGLMRNTLYRISTRTVDTNGNINRTWVNRTARTAP